MGCFEFSFPCHNSTCLRPASQTNLPWQDTTSDSRVSLRLRLDISDRTSTYFAWREEDLYKQRRLPPRGVRTVCAPLFSRQLHSRLSAFSKQHLEVFLLQLYFFFRRLALFSGIRVAGDWW